MKKMTSSSLVILQSFPSTPHQHQHSISDFWRNFHNFKHSHPPSQPWRNNLFRLFPCLLFFKKYCVRWLWRRISLPFFPYPSFYLLFKCVKRPPTVLPLPTLCSKQKERLGQPIQWAFPHLPISTKLLCYHLILFFSSFFLYLIKFSCPLWSF